MGLQQGGSGGDISHIHTQTHTHTHYKRVDLGETSLTHTHTLQEGGPGGDISLSHSHTLTHTHTHYNRVDLGETSLSHTHITRGWTWGRHLIHTQTQKV